jgi:hypothetical protein
MVGYRSGVGSEVDPEVFSFDETNHVAAGASGIAFQHRDSPIPAVMYTIGPDVTDRLCSVYGNIILDFGSLKEPLKSFNVGYIAGTETVAATNIDLSVGSARELFVSPAYVVFPDQTRTVQPDGPFVQLTFEPLTLVSPSKPGWASSPQPGSVLAISRNGIEVARTSFPFNYTLQLKRVRTANDVIALRVEDKSGKVSHQSSLGFPVSGAVPDLVKYTVTVH